MYVYLIGLWEMRMSYQSCQISKLIAQIDISNVSCEVAFVWRPMDIAGD